MRRKDPFVTGEYYHLYNRGIDKRKIFQSPQDYDRFVMLLYVANSALSFRLDDLVSKKNKKKNKTLENIITIDRGTPLIALGAWCLMTNHFHLLVKQEVDGGITRFMRKLSVGYSMYFNIRYQRQGALFGGLFKSRLVNADDTYLRHLFGYIHLNALDLQYPKWKKEIKNLSPETMKNMAAFLHTYPYSSYLDLCGSDRPESKILMRGAFPGYFERSDDFEDFMKSYLSVEIID